MTGDARQRKCTTFKNLNKFNQMKRFISQPITEAAHSEKEKWKMEKIAKLNTASGDITQTMITPFFDKIF